MDPTMDLLGFAPYCCDVIRSAEAIFRVANHFAESANNNREDQLSVPFALVDDAEELLGKMKGLQPNMQTIATVMTIPDHPIRQKLESLLNHARITCQKIKNTRGQAGRGAGLSREYGRAFIAMDKHGPKLPFRHPTTVPGATDQIPTHGTESEAWSPTPEEQLRGGDEHGSELEVLFLHLGDLGQQLLDLLGEDAARSIGTRENPAAPEKIRQMSRRGCSYCRGRGYEGLARNKENELQGHNDEPPFNVDARDNGHVMRHVRLEEVDRPTKWKLQHPAIPKVPKEKSNLHSKGLKSRRNDKEPQSGLPAVVMTAAVIGAMEMSVWDVFRRHNSAIQFILDPIVSTAETSSWDIVGRNHCAIAIPSIFDTLDWGSSLSVLSRPVVLISGTVLNITALTIYYHLRCGRGRPALRDLVLIAALSLAVGIGRLVGLDATSLLVLVAPWAAIMALLGTA